MITLICEVSFETDAWEPLLFGISISFKSVYLSSKSNLMHVSALDQVQSLF